MTRFSLIKVGDAYVVRAGDQCVLKVASRRRAAQLISEAVVLLNATSVSSQAQSAAEPTIDGDVPEAP